MFKEIKFFFLFVDEYSKMTSAYFMKQTSKALKKFIDSKEVVEKMSGCPFKTWRTNRGREFLATEFEEHLGNIIIRRQRTRQKTTQFNGMREQKLIFSRGRRQYYA